MKKIVLGGAVAALIFFGSFKAIEKANYRDKDSLLAEKGVIPSEDDIANALKEALQVGSTTAANNLNKPGAFLNDPLIKIPFPPDAINVANKLRELGMGKEVDQFIESMNHGAEDAAIKAAPIFVDAIKGMTLTDAKNILLGPDNAATTYFKNRTSGALFAAFSPEIKISLDKVQATKYWSQLTSKYNRMPFVKPVQTDLVKYTTDKALDGLFLKVADQEKSIRKNTPNTSAVSDNLKKVFDWAKGMK